MFKNKLKIKNWLNEMNIKNYTIDDNLTVSVKESVYLDFKELKYIPVQFATVDGDFFCNQNNLISLHGCPYEIGGAFKCNHNKLKSLQYGPKKVNSYFDCDSNQLKNLKYISDKINNHLYCTNNPIENIDDIKEVTGYCYFSNKENIQIKKLKQFYEHSGESLVISGQEIKKILLIHKIDLEVPFNPYKSSKNKI